MPEAFDSHSGGQQNSGTRRANTLASVFTLLGVFAVGFGALSLPAGLFVGPHVLAAAIGEIVVGTASLLIARGLWHGKRWSRWCAAALTLAIGAIIATGLVQSVIAGEEANSIFFSILLVVFGGLFIALLFISRQDAKLREIR